MGHQTGTGSAVCGSACPRVSRTERREVLSHWGVLSSESTASPSSEFRVIFGQLRTQHSELPGTVPHAAAVKKGQFNFTGGQFKGEVGAGYFCAIDAGAFKPRLAKIDTA